MALAPRSKGDLKLSVPADALAAADSLRLEFGNAAGGNIVTYDLRLKPERDNTPKMNTTDGSGLKFPRFNLVAMTYGNNAIGWRTATRHPCKLVNITANGMPVKDEDALGAMPMAGVRSMEADIALKKDESAQVGGHVHAEFVSGHFSY